MQNLSFWRFFHLWSRPVPSAFQQVSQFHSSSQMNEIPLCPHHIFFIHSFVDEHLTCFPILATMSNAAINTDMPVSLWCADSVFQVDGWQLSHMITIFSSSRNRHTNFHSDKPDHVPTSFVFLSFYFLEFFYVSNKVSLCCPPRFPCAPPVSASGAVWTTVCTTLHAVGIWRGVFHQKR